MACTPGIRPQGDGAGAALDGPSVQAACSDLGLVHGTPASARCLAADSRAAWLEAADQVIYGTF